MNGDGDLYGDTGNGISSKGWYSYCCMTVFEHDGFDEIDAELAFSTASRSESRKAATMGLSLTKASEQSWSNISFEKLNVQLSIRVEDFVVTKEVTKSKNVDVNFASIA